MPTDLLEPASREGKLGVFSVYADFQAAVHARWCACRIVSLAGKHWPCSSEVWTFDAFAAGGPIRRIITADAARADVLIVAVSTLDQRPVELLGWLDSLVTAPDLSGEALLIGLVGDEENRRQELNWTVRELIRCARKMPRDFIWHWMDEEALRHFDWLTEDVRKLLARKHLRHESFLMPGTSSRSW